MIFDKSNLLITFQGIPEILETYFKNIPQEVYDIKRNETAWSIREHLYHIINVQDMLYKRMLTIKNEENPIIKPYFPDKETESLFNYESIEKAFLYFKEMRAKQVLLINELTEFELNKEGKHEEYIKYNIPIIINHMIFHEYWHFYRIEEIWLTRDEFFS